MLSAGKSNSADVADKGTRDVERIGLINVDFKWKDGRVYPLEMDDAVIRSGFKGYNFLYGGDSDNQMMLKKMIQALKARYNNIHFIFNGLSEARWPRSQLKDVTYYDNISQFIQTAQANPQRFENDVLIYARNDEQQSPLMCRTPNEIQAWLLEEEIFIPVINASAMIYSADDKFIFSQLMQSIPKTKLIEVKCFADDVSKNIHNFSERVLLKPHTREKGFGVLMLTKVELAELASDLERYLTQKNKQKVGMLFEKLGPYRSKKLEELYQDCAAHPAILLQDHVESDLIEHEGGNYDATGRAVLLLSRKPTGEEDLVFVDAYWKLPEKPVNPDHFDEEASLSRVQGDGADLDGVAKLTDQERAAISSAFQEIKVGCLNLFGSKIDFYLSRIEQLSDIEQQVLTKFFIRQGFDTVEEHHNALLSKIIPSISGLGFALIRTLLIELASFIQLPSLSAYPPFLQKNLLHYLASADCPINFSSIKFDKDSEQINFTLILKQISENQLLDQSISRNAQAILNKMLGDDERAKKEFQACQKQASEKFKEQQYQEAHDKWKQAISFVTEISSSPEEEKEKLAVLYNNLGVCCRKLKQYSLAIQYFNDSLKNRTPGTEGYEKTLEKKKRCEELNIDPTDRPMSVFCKPYQTNFIPELPPATYLHAQQYQAVRLDLADPESSVVALCSSGMATCFAVICFGKTKLSLAHTHVVEYEPNPFNQIVNEILWTDADHICLVRNPNLWEKLDRREMFSKYLGKLKSMLKKSKREVDIEVVDAPKNHVFSVFSRSTFSAVLFRDKMIDTSLNLSPRTEDLFLGGRPMTPEDYDRNFLSREEFNQASQPQPLTAKQVYQQAMSFYKNNHYVHAALHSQRAVELYLHYPDSTPSMALANMYYGGALSFEKSGRMNDALHYIEQGCEVLSKLKDVPEQTRVNFSNKKTKARKALASLLKASHSDLESLVEETYLTRRLTQQTGLRFFNYKDSEGFITASAVVQRRTEQQVARELVVNSGSPFQFFGSQPPVVTVDRLNEEAVGNLVQGYLNK